MRFGHRNGIGALLTITIGATVFAFWLFVCYPTTAHELVNQSRQSGAFILLLGFLVVAVIGVTIAGTVLHGLLMLLQNLLQLALIIAIVVGGVWLWQRQSSNPQGQPPIANHSESSPSQYPIEQPNSKPPQNHWWK